MLFDCFLSEYILKTIISDKNLSIFQNLKNPWFCDFFEFSRVNIV